MSRLHLLLRVMAIAALGVCLGRADDAAARPAHRRARPAHRHRHHHDRDRDRDRDQPDDGTARDGGDMDAGDQDGGDMAGGDHSGKSEDQTDQQDQRADHPGQAEGAEDQPATAITPTTPGTLNEGPVDKSGVPYKFRRIEVRDVTTGMREDTFWSIEIGKHGEVHVGTWEGRSYISRDHGTTWGESWIIPEVKQLYGYAGQTMLLGHIRCCGTQIPDFAHLAPGQGYSFSQVQRGQMYNSGNSKVELTVPTLGGMSSGLGNSTGTVGGGQPSLFGANGGVGSAAVSGFNSSPEAPEYGRSPEFIKAYQGGFSPKVTSEAERVREAPGIVLGAGLSARAPRLSVLLRILRLPIANISLNRMLLTFAKRWTDIRKVIEDPANSRHLLAATHYGLYQSFDAGVSWLRTFSGLTQFERGILDIQFDPTDPKRVYMGTEGGLFVSDNSGNSWTKSTAVPEFQVKKIAVDPSNHNNVYVVGYPAGVFRSNDRLASAVLSYYSTIPRFNDVQWITIDPTNPDRAFIGTGHGIVSTDKLRTATVKDWKFMKSTRFEGLVVPVIRICPRHPHHIYAMTRADLPMINYGANGPEAYLLESWDDGQHWRILAGNRTQGDVRYFTLDPDDPDEPWVAFSRAVVQIKRVAAHTSVQPVNQDVRALPGEPSIGEVLEHTLEHYRVDMGTYNHDLKKLRYALYLPDKLDVTFWYGRSSLGEKLDDLQFAQSRYLVGFHHTEWRVMAFASWRLPTIVYYNKAVAMLKQRENVLDDVVRNQLMITIHRDYGELLRLEAQERAGPKGSLYTRAVRRARIQRLEAVVDLASGGYLSKRRKELHQQQGRSR